MTFHLRQQGFVFKGDKIQQANMTPLPVKVTVTQVYKLQLNTGPGKSTVILLICYSLVITRT